MRLAGWLATGAIALLLAGCSEDPLELDGRVWAVEQGSRSLLRLDPANSACNSQGYLSRDLGPIAIDGYQRFLLVDQGQRMLVELDPVTRITEDLFDLIDWVSYQAMTVDLYNRLYLLADEGKLVHLDPESPVWRRSWPIRPEGDWKGLAALPIPGVGVNGESLPAGTLLAWRSLASGGELVWLELLEEEARAHVLRSTPVLSGLAVSFREERLLAFLDGGAELVELDPFAASGTIPLQVFDCEELHLKDFAMP
jgi:hypothetical protein